MQSSVFASIVVLGIGILGFTIFVHAPVTGLFLSGIAAWLAVRLNSRGEKE